MLMPDKKNGKICYVEIPASDIPKSSQFYEKVFGWTLRKRGDGAIAFDDTVGGVSGTWVTDRPPSGSPGMLTYIMVDSVAKTIEKIVANGGSVAQSSTAIGTMTIARFRDPAGNVLGLYQEG
jgi:uncharacterized protein